jgi:hypothetical protein
MRMVFNRSLILITAALVLNGCSKLADYSLDIPNTVGSATPIPASPSPSPSVTVPAAIHEWGFEQNGTDAIGSWNGTLSPSTYSTSAEVGTYSAQFTTGGSFTLGAQTIPNETTVSCWIKWISGSGTDNTIIANSASGASTSGFRFYVVQSTGKLVLETGNGSTGVSVDSNSALGSGAYTFVAVEVDNVLNQSAIYINGALDQSGSVQTGYSMTTALSLGSMAGATSSFNGELDDCRIFNVALSSQQVLTLYNSY